MKEGIVKKVTQFLIFAAGVIVAGWAMKDRLLPKPETPSTTPPSFRDPTARPAAPSDTAVRTPPATPRPPAVTEPDTLRSPDDLTKVKGIGKVYAGKLADAGINTLAALADADAGDLADRVGVSESQIGDWIAQAVDLR